MPLCSRCSAEIAGKRVKRVLPGVSRKQAREAARAVMPNMTETRIVVSGNHRAWRFVVARRIDEGADAEIREVAGMLLAELRKLAPSCYQDFE